MALVLSSNYASEGGYNEAIENLEKIERQFNLIKLSPGLNVRE